jgi:hypothetical protein
VAVHRVDAAIALGSDFMLEPDIAADGITEWLERVAIQAGSDGEALPLEEGNTIHLHATDSLSEPGEWTIGLRDGRISWSHEHGKGTVALRGRASVLLLALVRRVQVGDTDVEVFGDDSVWHNWLERTAF